MNFDLFRFRKVWVFSPAVQIAIMVVLYLLTVAVWYDYYLAHGAMPGASSGHGYPVNTWLTLSGVYEEVIFRGFILGALLAHTSRVRAIIFSSALFGLWHVKNVFYQGWEDTLHQTAYAGLFIGPLLGWLVVRTRTIWPGVIVHMANNTFAPLSWVTVAYFVGP
ncbi:MAG TPA: CPBP family intramembrane metalloprotease [bacterium]|nr:CPBP family intramembrane metalloprotease [bacterium]